MPDMQDPAELRIELSEARTDTKFAQVLGEFRASLAKIDGRFEKIEGQFAAVTATLTSMREENRAALIGMREENRETRANVRTWGQWTIGTIVVSVFALAALGVGLKQVWLSGFGEGQTHQEAAHGAAQQPPAQAKP